MFSKDLYCRHKKPGLVWERVPLGLSGSLFGTENVYFELTLSQTTNLKLLQTLSHEEFADDNFEFDENGGNVSERIENTAGKGEIARYEQFLLFPQCFQKSFIADT